MIHLEKNNLDELIKEGTHLLDFYAEWCGPCKMLAMEIEKAASEIDIDIVKVNVDIINRTNILHIEHNEVLSNISKEVNHTSCSNTRRSCQCLR